jgi:hypothetical protein
MITAERSVQFTGNYLPCNIFQIDVWFFVICKLYGNLCCGELRVGPAMRSNGPLAQVHRCLTFTLLDAMYRSCANFLLN